MTHRVLFFGGPPPRGNTRSSLFDSIDKTAAGAVRLYNNEEILCTMRRVIMDGQLNIT